MQPEIHKSARKHYHRDRLTDDAVIYAYKHAQCSSPLDNDSDPRRWLVIGVDPAARFLELVILIFDDDTEMIIHAMKARKKYLYLLDQ